MALSDGTGGAGAGSGSVQIVASGDSNNLTPFSLAPNTFTRITLVAPVPIANQGWLLDPIRSALTALGFTVNAIWASGNVLTIEGWT